MLPWYHLSLPARRRHTQPLAGGTSNSTEQSVALTGSPVPFYSPEIRIFQADFGISSVINPGDIRFPLPAAVFSL